MFVLTLNGNELYINSEGEPRLQIENALGLLKAYEQKFTEQFWKYVVIVVTYWDNSLTAKKLRQKKGITEAKLIN